MHAVWVHIWSLQREKYKSDHDLESKIKAKPGADDSGGIRENRQRKDTVSQTAPMEDLPLLSRFDSRTCDSQLRNYARGCMGPNEHRTPAGTKTKRNLQRTQLTHTHAPPLPALLPSPPSSLHRIIPLTLFQDLFFCGCFKHNINGVWEAVLQKGRRGDHKPPSLFPFLHWSCHHPDADFSKWPPQVCWWNPHDSSLKGDRLP